MLRFEFPINQLINLFVFGFIEIPHKAILVKGKTILKAEKVAWDIDSKSLFSGRGSWVILS